MSLTRTAGFTVGKRWPPYRREAAGFQKRDTDSSRTPCTYSCTRSRPSSSRGVGVYRDGICHAAVHLMVVLPVPLGSSSTSGSGSYMLIPSASAATNTGWSIAAGSTRCSAGCAGHSMSRLTVVLRHGEGIGSDGPRGRRAC